MGSLLIAHADLVVTMDDQDTRVADGGVAIVDQNVLWVRSLEAVDPLKLDRTDGATYPFWSPDNASIGFFAGGQLKRIARTGGL